MVEVGSFGLGEDIDKNHMVLFTIFLIFIIYFDKDFLILILDEELDLFELVDFDALECLEDHHVLDDNELSFDRVAAGGRFNTAITLKNGQGSEHLLINWLELLRLFLWLFFFLLLLLFESGRQIHSIY